MQKSKFFSAKKIAVMGVLTALSLIMFLVESLFPPLFIPGAKMGLSNIFSYIALIMYSPIECFIIIVARSILGGIFSGNMFSIIYSLTAGIISSAASALLIYAVKKFSPLAVSALSAVIHNMVQLVIYYFVTGTTAVFYYAPYLAAAGILAGAIVGAATIFIIKLTPEGLADKLL